MNDTYLFVEFSGISGERILLDITRIEGCRENVNGLTCVHMYSGLKHLVDVEYEKFTKLLIDKRTMARIKM